MKNKNAVNNKKKQRRLTVALFLLLALLLVPHTFARFSVANNMGGGSPIALTKATEGDQTLKAWLEVKAETDPGSTTTPTPEPSTETPGPTDPAGAENTETPVSESTPAPTDADPTTEPTASEPADEPTPEPASEPMAMAVEETTTYTYTAHVQVGDTEQSDFKVAWTAPDGVTETEKHTYQGPGAEVKATVTYQGLTMKVSVDATELDDSSESKKDGNEVTWGIEKIEQVSKKNEWTITFNEGCGVSEASALSIDNDNANNFKIEKESDGSVKVVLKDDHTDELNPFTVNATVGGKVVGSSSVSSEGEDGEFHPDVTPPTVKLELPKDTKVVENGSNYFIVVSGTEVELTITVKAEDKDFDGETAKGDGTFTWSDGEDGTTHTCTIKVTKGTATDTVKLPTIQDTNKNVAKTATLTVVEETETPPREINLGDNCNLKVDADAPTINGIETAEGIYFADNTVYYKDTPSSLTLTVEDTDSGVGSVSYAFSSAENATSVDAGAWKNEVTHSSGNEYTIENVSSEDLTAGNKLYIKAVDQAENENITSYELKADNVGPTITVSADGIETSGTQYKKETVTFTITVKDEISGIVDPGSIKVTYNDNTQTVNFSNIGRNGEYTGEIKLSVDDAKLKGLTVEATDMVGNSSTNSDYANVNVTIDKTKPEVTLTCDYPIYKQGNDWGVVVPEDGTASFGYTINDVNPKGEKTGTWTPTISGTEITIDGTFNDLAGNEPESIIIKNENLESSTTAKIEGGKILVTKENEALEPTYKKDGAEIDFDTVVFGGTFDIVVGTTDNRAISAVTASVADNTGWTIKADDIEAGSATSTVHFTAPDKVSDKFDVFFTITDNDGKEYHFKQTLNIDTTDPVVTVTADAANAELGTENAPKYYTSAKFTVTVEDENFGINTTSGKLFLSETPTDFVEIESNAWTHDRDGKYTATVEVTDQTKADAITEIKASVTDLAGNEKTSEALDANLIVDGTPPEVTITSEDEAATTPEGGPSYYDKVRTFTVEVKDRNIDPEANTDAVEVKIDGASVVINDWQSEELPDESGNILWTGTVKVSDQKVADADCYVYVKDDAIEKITVTATDKAGKTGTITKEDETFVIDTVTPVVEITPASITGPTGPDGVTSHIKNKQEITITVTEKNFDATRTNLEIKIGGQTVEAPKLSWTDEDGDKHTASFTVSDKDEADVKTTRDPITGISVTVYDYAHGGDDSKDHTAEAQGPKDFLVDTTDPVVTINVPSGGTFRNSPQTISVTVTDIFFNASGSSVTVDGQNVGTWSGSGDTWTLSFTLSDTGGAYPKTTQFGSVSVTAVDYAGNGTSDSRPLGFTVDTVAATGSITLPTDPVNQRGGTDYYDAEQTLAFTAEDTNFESATITVTVNGENKTFSMGNARTLTVSDLEGDLVTQDGALTYVHLHVVDKAGNTSDFEEPVNLIVDTTEPSVSASLSGNVASAFYTVEDGRRIYYIVPREVINDDNKGDEPRTEEFTLTVTATDKNIALAGEENTRSFNTTFTSAGGSETWSRNGDVYTVVKRVAVDRNRTGLLRFDTRIIDLAGNTAAGPVSVMLTGTAENGLPSVMTLDFDENGAASIDARIDRRQSSTGFDGEEPTVEITPNVDPSAKTMSEAALPLFGGGLSSFDMMVYEGRQETPDADQNLNNSGIAQVTWTLDDGIGNSYLSTANGDNVLGQVTENVLNGTPVLQHDFTIPIRINGANETNDAVLTLTITDNVGNTIYKEYSFGVDTQAPRVTVSYDNNSVLNGKYFAANRVATVTVTDINFDPNDPALQNIVTETGSSGWQSLGSGNYSCSYAYTTDGDYTFQAWLADRVGNATEDAGVTYNGEAVREFTLDKTLPVITVTFDNNDVRNGHYYKANRIGTIQVEEHNFEPQDVLVTTTAYRDGAAIGIPAASAFTTGSDTHVASVPFTTDGDYTIRVEYTDLAGNVAVEYVGDLFTIDTVAPEIVISGVEFINAGTAAPVVSFSDINFDGNAYSVDVSFSQMLQPREADLSRAITGPDSHGATVTYNDIPHLKNNDGIYEFTARATDLAGNEADVVNQVFSVNRFGSTYLTQDNSTRDLIGNGYTKSAQNLQVVEINPNQLTESSITITVNGKTITLVKDRDYSVTLEGDDNIGYRYTYNIFSTAFEENATLREGAYVVTFYSEDKAGNANSNRTNTTFDADGNESLLELDFTIDATSPTISVTGVQSGDRIQEASREVTVYFSDGNEVAVVQIYLNGELYKEIAGDEIGQSGGQYAFTVDEQDYDQTLNVVAKDAAGNEIETGDIQFYLNSSAFMQFVHNRPLFFGTVGGAGGLAALGVGLALYMKKKKKTEKEPVHNG